MSLDTKKSEIRKLEERAAQREEALKRSKELLDQHQQKFDDFLAEDRDKVQTAQTKAEIQTKIKVRVDGVMHGECGVCGRGG